MEPFDELAARVDQLRDQVSHADESTQALLRETIEAITEFNRRGLITLVQMLREDERGGEQPQMACPPGGGRAGRS